jgi:hypothetical protein
MSRRIWIALALYAAVSVLAALVYSLVPGSLAPEVKLVMLSVLGPSLALFTHMFLLAYGLATLTTLPWFLGYAANRKSWLMVAGVAVWLAWGAVFSYTLVPSDRSSVNALESALVG